MAWYQNSCSNGADGSIDRSQMNKTAFGRLLGSYRDAQLCRPSDRVIQTRLKVWVVGNVLVKICLKLECKLLADMFRAAGTCSRSRTRSHSGPPSQRGPLWLGWHRQSPVDGVRRVSQRAERGMMLRGVVSDIRVLIDCREDVEQLSRGVSMLPYRTNGQNRFRSLTCLPVNLTSSSNASIDMSCDAAPPGFPNMAKKD